MASERLALNSSGQVRYRLETPYRDGTTHIVLEPQVIAKILLHRQATAPQQHQPELTAWGPGAAGAVACVLNIELRGIAAGE